MYKILLATNQQVYVDVFSQAETFENLGFRAPRIADSVEAAIACLKKHHIDAIAYHFSKEDDALMFEHLQQFYPNLPIVKAEKTVKKQVEALLQLRTLLNCIYADFSDDNYNEADMLALSRHAFFRDLLSEHITTQQEVSASLLLLRSAMDPEKPCVVIDMSVPDGEDYFAGKWHYGADRLEVALRNFFCHEMLGLRVLPAVVAPDTIRLLACPVLGSHDNDLSDQSITGAVYEHAQSAISEAQTYLALDIQIANVHVLPNLMALVTKEQ